MISRPCAIGGCVKPVKARNWCAMHYGRWRRNGDPHIVTRDWGHGKTAELVSYYGAHDRVYKVKGRAADRLCQCGDPAKHWAYNHGDPHAITELVHVRGVPIPLEFSLNPDHYIPLCQPCHRDFDHRSLPQRDGTTGRWTA